MKTKNASFKTLTVSDEGIVEAIVSVFGNVDSYGDVVMLGAFKNTISEWQSRGHTPTILLNHDKNLILGKVLELREIAAGDELLPEELKNNGGLYCKFQYNLSADALKAREIYSHHKFGSINEFSFAFEVVGQNGARVNEHGGFDLLDMKLFEVSVCVVGANPATETLSIKTINAVREDIKAGRVISQSNMATLQGIADSLTDQAKQLNTLIKSATPEKSNSRLGRLKRRMGVITLIQGKN